MRIARLDLARYGRFTDATLDLPAPAPGEPDLHIVYGRNEAGKSTLFSAWLDLLYGIEPRSTYDFLHPYPTMKIGATLDLEGRSLTVSRIKKQQNALLDATGAPLPETVLQAALGGINRDGYMAMFSLDDDTLKEGGESILASQGDFGQLLFSASAGLAGLTGTLDALRAESESFHRPRAQKTRLREMRAELDALDARLRDLDTGASENARLIAAEAAATAAHRAAEAALADTTARLAATHRSLAALPTLARLHRTEAELATLPDLPALPDGWFTELPDLARDATDTAARIEEAGTIIATLEARLAELRPDPEALALIPRLADLAPLKAARDTATADLPQRRTEADDAARNVAALLHRLGQPTAEPQGLLLDAAMMATLRAQLAARSGVLAALSAAGVEVDAARRTAADAEARFQAVGTAPAPAALAALLARLRAHDPAQALRLARRDDAQAQTTLATRLAALAPWRGSGAALAALTTPSRDQLDRIARETEAATLALHAAQAETARLRTGVSALADQAPNPAPALSELRLSTLRTEREALWAAHRKTLTAQTADAFEAALRGDDLAQIRRLEGHAEATRLAQALANLDQTRTALALAEAQQAQCAITLDSHRATLAALIRGLSTDLPREMSLPALRDWLVLRAPAVEAQAACDVAQTALRLADCDAAEAAAALAAALDHPPAPFDALLAEAETRLAAATKAQALHEIAAAAARDRARRDEDLDRATAAEAAWSAAWAATAGKTWLGRRADPATLPAVLATLDALTLATGTHAALADRIAKMEANLSAFAAALALLAPGTAEADASTAYATLDARAAQATTAARTQHDTQAELDAKRTRLSDLHRAATRTSVRITVMAQHFGVQTLDDLTSQLTTAAHAASLRAEAATHADTLCETLGSTSSDAARAVLEATDRASLDHADATLTAARQRQSAEAQENYAVLSDLRRQLAAIGGDDAVARLQTDREALLLAMAEEATVWLRLRLGLLATDTALRAYRDGHRSAMLNRASQAFAAISENAYSGLATHPDRDREQLVAIAANGASKQAQHLSKGTRFQLYLALRVAGFHEFAQNRPTVPFIADDIMETFDNGRAAQSFAVLSDMARVGQVIYLTHHAHLCDIARTVTPGVRVHDLR